MPQRHNAFVLFAAAAGPELGFGHLVRCGVLADALGAARVISLRGSEHARLTALHFGWTVHDGPSVLDALWPDLIVVDDPSSLHRDRWIRLARHARIPVAAIFDGGSEDADADLVIDGSFTARPDHRASRCAGPEWAVLPAAIAARRQRPLVRDRRRVLVALGGGAHVRRAGVGIADAIVSRAPDLHVDLAAGFARVTRADLPPRTRWIQAPSGLVDPLASARVAVVAGGITLYEACALGTAAVAVPVVPAQRPAISAAAAVGAVTAVAGETPAISAAAVAAAVCALVENPGRAAVQAAVAASLVDGNGAARAAARLRALMRTWSGGRRHAA